MTTPPTDPGHDPGPDPATDPGHPVNPARPSFTLTQVANGTGKSPSTIKRMRQRGEFPHAHRGQTGEWLIPIDDIIAADLRMTQPTTRANDPVTQGHDLPVTQLQASYDLTQVSDLARENADLRHALDLERARREAAEQLATAHERSLADLRTALRMIETRHAEPVEQPPPAPEQPAPQPSPAPTPYVEPARRPGRIRRFFTGQDNLP